MYEVKNVIQNIFSKIKSITAVGDRLFYASFAFLLALKSGYYFFKYYPIIDDWFLFLAASTYKNKWSEVVVAQNKLQLRPLAGLLDAYVTGGFLANNLSLLYFLLTAMLCSSAIIFHKTLKNNNINVGPLFFIVFALTPISAEALYWIGASSRIIPSILLIAIAGCCADIFAKTGSKKTLTAFAVTSLLSVGLYEATLPILIIYPAIILFLNRKNGGNPLKKLLPAAIPVVFALGMFVYYRFNGDNPDIASRGGLVTQGFLDHFRNVFLRFANVFTMVNLRLSGHALKVGAKTIVKDRAFIFAFFTVASSVVFGCIVYKNEKKKENATLKSIFKHFIIGLLLFAAGLSLNFLLSGVRISLRVVYISFIGLGVMLDAVFLKIKLPVIKSVFISLIALLCVTANVGELAEYKITSETDEAIAKTIIETEGRGNLVDPEKIGFILGAVDTYVSGTGLYFEHIKASTEVYASVTGSVMYYIGGPRINNIMTVRDGETFNLHFIDKFYEMYYFYGLEVDDDGKYRAVKLIPMLDANDAADFFTLDDRLYGGIVPADDGVKYYFKLY